ncbi:Cytochrome c oxidase subunit 6 [Saitoella coloradoensis]
MQRFTAVIRTAPALRVARVPRAMVAAGQIRSMSSAHDEEDFDSFNARYTKFFEECEDVFELQRGLNNSFSYDLVPSPETVTSALKAARRINDYATAVRVFEGLKQKVENKTQYQAYVDELAPIRKELGIELPEELVL